MEEADWISLELLALRLVSLDIGQTLDAMPLQAPVQRRARQVRDRQLNGVEAVVQRQQHMTPEGDNHRFLGLRQHC